MSTEENLNSGKTMQNFSLEWSVERLYPGDEVVVNFFSSWTVPILLSSLYLILVFAGRRFMENRPKYELRPLLFVWSLFLAIFSIVCIYRTFGYFLDTFYERGFLGLLCDYNLYTAPVVRFWVPIFGLSKFLEFGDTAFIILRKQKLIFLHWYHHYTVSLFCWLMNKGQLSGGLYFMVLNYLVHSFMYTYYTFRAAKYQLPKWISIFITSFQIVQMIIGTLVMIALAYWSDSPNCRTSTDFLVFGLIMYFSYLVLFVKFFSEAYLKKPKGSNIKAQKILNETPTGEKLLATNSNGTSESETSYLPLSNSLRKRIN